MNDAKFNAKLVEILEAALRHFNNSIEWFKQSQDIEDSYQYKVSMREDDMARGILETYYILTGSHVNGRVSVITEIDCLKENHPELKLSH